MAETSQFTDKIAIELGDDGVAWIRLNNPDRMNSMDEELGSGLLQEAARLGDDPAVRVIVLTGSGRAFSAGGDFQLLEENTKTPPHLVEQRMRAFYARYLTLREIPKPVIAAINGFAVGAGMCIAMACDLRIAAHEAKMGLNFAKLGLSPGMAATYLLPRIVGVPQALDLLFTGRLIPGDEAERMGLVNRSVAADELESAAGDWASEIAAAAPVALRLIKSYVHASPDGTLEDALAREAAGQAMTFQTADLKEGLSAIRDKRDPIFQGE